MQTARDFVSIRIELAAGMQLGHHDFGCGPAFFLHYVNRDAAAVVDYGYRVVKMDCYLDRVAVSGECFVD